MNIKKCLFSSILFLCICFSCIEAEVRRIYVSPLGNDLNQGTKEQPLASLTGARNKIRQLKQQHQINDTIYVDVLQGEYFMDQPLELTPLDGGTATSPVVYRAQTGSRPVFYGGLEVNRFEVIKQDMWRVYIPEVVKYGLTFEQLYINGERRFRAQTPNRGDFNFAYHVKETFLDTNQFVSQKVTLHQKDVDILKDINKEEMADALIVFYHKWDNTRKRIENISVKDTSLYITGAPMQHWNKLDHTTRYYVENYRKALDAPGEWFLERDGYLYYIPISGETPENTRCFIPLLEQFMTVQGDEDTRKYVEHVYFQGLNFHVAGYRTPLHGNEPSQAAAPVKAAVMVNFARNIEFFDCEFAHTGVHAIWFKKACSYSKVQQCYLYDLGGGAVKIGETQRNFSAELITNHILIDNNIIHNGGNVFPCCVAVIIFNASDNILTHNDIANYRYSGVSTGWTWGYAPNPAKRNKIEYNHIHHLGWGELCDMGGVYTLGATEGTTVSNNHIHHIYSYSYGGWGLYTDEGSTGIIMENNLVYACKSSGFHQHYGKENILRNNIFANNISSQIQLTRIEDHLSFSFTNNIVYYDQGVVFLNLGRNIWQEAKTKIDYNCYWDAGNSRPEILGNYNWSQDIAEPTGLSFNDWKKLGKDQHSVIADPLFVDPQNFDFRFKKNSAIKKINFNPFDYTKAGVYGNEEWRNKAKMNPELEKKFDRMVAIKEGLKKNKINKIEQNLEI